MLSLKYPLERVLQQRRFDAAKEWLVPPILDIGGNNGELGDYLGIYVEVCNDVQRLPEGRWETAAILATVEHIPVNSLPLVVPRVERIVVTTPTPGSHAILKLWSLLGLLDAENLNEHRQYFTRSGLEYLFTLPMIVYKRFDVFNQLAVYGEGT